MVDAEVEVEVEVGVEVGDDSVIAPLESLMRV
jgi:hypothetical protein